MGPKVQNVAVVISLIKRSMWGSCREQTDFSQRCTVTGQEATDTNCSNGNSN